MPLSPHVPDLASLDLLVSVARHGSIGRAAAAHGISQPSASHRLRTMERLVGVALLERTPRGSRLTASGALLVEWADAVVDAASALDGGIAALRQERDSKLRLAASLTIAEYLLPGWLTGLRSRRPDTAVALRVANSSRVAEALREGSADLGFVEGPARPAGLRSVTVARDRLVVVTAPQHRWARRGGPTPIQLRDTPLVGREEGSGTRAAYVRALRAWGEPVPSRLELASTTAVKSAVMASAGAAVVSSLAVKEELTDGRLVAIDVPGVDLRRRLRAVWPAGARPTGPAEDLLAGITAGRRAAAFH